MKWSERKLWEGEEVSTWDKNYLGLCDYIKEWSKDPSSQFGAAIVDSRGNPVSLGVNGFPRGLKDTEERWEDRSLKYPRVIHAEKNAIFFAMRNLEGCTLYCNGVPCVTCAGDIAQVGINMIICYEPNENYLKRWSVDDTIESCLETGVKLRMVNRDNHKVTQAFGR